VSLRYCTNHSSFNHSVASSFVALLAFRTVDFHKYHLSIASLAHSVSCSHTANKAFSLSNHLAHFTQDLAASTGFSLAVDTKFFIHSTTFFQAHLIASLAFFKAYQPSDNAGVSNVSIHAATLLNTQDWKNLFLPIHSILVSSEKLCRLAQSAYNLATSSQNSLVSFS
jgi:hypothetical protein